MKARTSVDVICDTNVLSIQKMVDSDTIVEEFT